jgi:hypothetical protein
MTAARVSFASVVNDHAVADRYLLASIAALDEPAPVFALSNVGNELGMNLARLYNVLKRVHGPPLRVFAHPDVTFEGDLVQRLLAAIAQLEARGASWGALGIVGRAWEGEYVWCNELEEPAPVSTLDSCFLATRTNLGLDFDDDRFDELHCFVEDYCLQCHAAELGVWVLPATATHEDVTFSRMGSRWGSYDRYRKRLDRKWRKRLPGFTTT